MQVQSSGKGQGGLEGEVKATRLFFGEVRGCASARSDVTPPRLHIDYYLQAMPVIRKHLIDAIEERQTMQLPSPSLNAIRGQNSCNKKKTLDKPNAILSDPCSLPGQTVFCTLPKIRAPKLRPSHYLSSKATVQPFWRNAVSFLRLLAHQACTQSIHTVRFSRLPLLRSY